MQERYLGDVHDFMKYALLRHLHERTGLAIGLNWYLTCPTKVDKAGNNDGGNRYHFDGGVWDEIDSELVEGLRQFNEHTARKLSDFESAGLLPANTLYHSDEVAQVRRADWHQSAIRNLAAADLVFLDPDNGFLVPSASPRTVPKYALYEEVVGYYEAGKVVVCIQFARQCKPQDRADSVRSRLAELTTSDAALPIIRCRVSPNILFVTLCPTDRRSELTAALRGFSDHAGDKVMLI